MSKKESRQERKQQENKNESSNSGISKVYYWIIGILFIVLIGLVFFIFSQSGDDVAIEDDSASDSEMVEEDPNGTNETETGTETEEDTSEEDTTDESDQSDDTSDESEDTEENTSTDEEETTEEDTTEEDTTDEDASESEEDSTAVNEDAPLNESYAVDYGEGSADRVAIREQVMQATGLGNDLIEWWVGNNGPGRVVATVSNGEQTEHYEVYLQYGDGSWHVTSYQQLAENPGN